jgi:hypothetical protein
MAQVPGFVPRLLRVLGQTTLESRGG